MPPAQALSIAEEKGLDLVEIAATATPPVCRIMNSGKFFYQQAKRSRRRASTSGTSRSRK